MASDELLRIGELAVAAGISTRTVDYYTALGLLAPVRRTGGNFRLYRPADVSRVALIRQLEAHGLRLDDIARALQDDPKVARSPHADEAPEQGLDGEHLPDAAALPQDLASLEQHVHRLRELTTKADPRTRGLLAILTTRAHALLATAVIVGGQLAEELDVLPPL